MKRIILLNGPSSAGKSTLAKSLQTLIEDKRNERYEVVSIDDFMKLSQGETIYEDDVFEISADICKRVVQVLKICPGVIIDHVITSERIFNQLQEMVHPHNLQRVHVTCPLEILLRRERERRNRCMGSAESSYMYLFPKDGYDLTVDTHSMTTLECAMKIYEKIFEL